MSRATTTTYGISEKVMEELFDIAKECGVERIKIFGSRARGDYYQTSDIDLAVWGGNISCFVADIDEKTSTLLKYDVVNMDNPVQKELMEKISKEGVVIYEKS